MSQQLVAFGIKARWQGRAGQEHSHSDCNKQANLRHIIAERVKVSLTRADRKPEDSLLGASSGAACCAC